MMKRAAVVVICVIIGIVLAGPVLSQENADSPGRYLSAPTGAWPWLNMPVRDDAGSRLILFGVPGLLERIIPGRRPTMTYRGSPVLKMMGGEMGNVYYGSFDNRENSPSNNKTISMTIMYYVW